MRSKIPILILLLFLPEVLGAQEKYILPSDFKDLTFKEFTSRTEKLFPIKFFYKDEWVHNLKIGEYPNCYTLSCILDNLFEGTSLYYIIEESGNIVITNNYAIKVSDISLEKNNKFLPPIDYSVSGENQQIAGNATVEIGNPAEKNNPGNVVVSGYITNKDTKEPVPGVTVFIKKLSTGTISNEYGYYTPYSALWTSPASIFIHRDERKDVQSGS